MIFMIVVESEWVGQGEPDSAHDLECHRLKVLAVMCDIDGSGVG